MRLDIEKKYLVRYCYWCKKERRFYWYERIYDNIDEQFWACGYCNRFILKDDYLEATKEPIPCD